MPQSKNPDPNVVFPNEYKTSVFLKNVVSAPNIFVGDYTYYDSAEHPEDFEKTQVLFNYPDFGDKLVIGKFCQIAHGTTFIMGAANHRLSSISTYPFNVMGKTWNKATPDHLSELPHKGDIVIGNDVWLGRECVIMPGVKIDDELISLLLQWKWWDLEGDELFESLSILVNPDLGNVRLQIRALLAK